MNIIQIQDRLKGMPKEDIISYVQNPTGDVPTFLALGELQRRKDADQKYMAMQEEPASVAEQLVAENMPMGLAGMAPSAAVNPSMATAPEGGISNVPSQAMEPSSVQAANSGIGALPVPEQNFANGGIIAFQEGGLALDPITGLPLVTDEYLTGQTDEPNMMTEDRATEEARQKLADENKAEMEMLKRRREQKEAMEQPQPKPQLDDIEVTPEPGMRDYVQEYKDIMGEDTYNQRLEERLSKLDERAAKQESMDPYLALTEAGLAMAAGDSPFALQNIAAGAGRGIQAYGESRDRMANLEQKRMAILDQMAQADRNARMAAVQYGMQSKQHADALATKKALADQAAQIDLIKAQAGYQGKIDAARIGQELKQKDRADLETAIIQDPATSGLTQFEEYYRKNKGKRFLDTDEYARLREDWIDKKVTELSQPRAGTLSYLGTE
jgi:hypothetical protein